MIERFVLRLAILDTLSLSLSLSLSPSLPLPTNGRTERLKTGTQYTRSSSIYVHTHATTTTYIHTRMLLQQMGNISLASMHVLVRVCISCTARDTLLQFGLIGSAGASCVLRTIRYNTQQQSVTGLVETQQEFSELLQGVSGNMKTLRGREKFFLLRTYTHTHTHYGRNLQV